MTVATSVRCVKNLPQIIGISVLAFGFEPMNPRIEPDAPIILTGANVSAHVRVMPTAEE